MVDLDAVPGPETRQLNVQGENRVAKRRCCAFSFSGSNTSYGTGEYRKSPYGIMDKPVQRGAECLIQRSNRRRVHRYA